MITPHIFRISKHPDPAPLKPYLKYSVSASLISLPLFLQTFFSLICHSSLPSSIRLISPLPLPLFTRLSLPSFITPSSSLSFPLFFPPSPPALPLPPHFSQPLCLKFPPCGCVLLTSHLLWCELHICEWMTGKINNPALPFSLTVGLSNE